jgi:hypothetical protein
VTPTLTNRQRNRALLARQHLIAKADMTVDRMLDHLVGMQAQEPRDPYTALFSRLSRFDPQDLERMLLDRSAVRMPVMRTTLHLVNARDASLFWSMARPNLSRVFRSTAWGRHLVTANAPLDEIVTAGAELLAGAPMSSVQLRTALAERFPEYEVDALVQAVHYLAPVVQTPPRGLWTATGRPIWTTMQAWLGYSPSELTDADLDSIVLRYLAAFGPANAADVTTWSGRTGTREILERLRPQLIVFKDEQGRELFDLPDAPRPPEDTPAPPRFFPIYDNIGLSHKDRRHIIPAEAVGRLDGWVGWMSVDGYLHGQWDVTRDGASATIEISELTPLTNAEKAEIEPEALALLRMHAPDAASHNVTFRPLSRWHRRSAPGGAPAADAG